MYDVAAEDGGGLFVLNNFYQDVLTFGNKDFEWYFIVSTNEIKETDRVRVLCYPEVKTSWIARLEFEYVRIPKIFKELNPDFIISLQNMPINRCGVRQFVYLHQSLQFLHKKFSLLKSEECSLAIRQKFISAFIKNAMPKAEHIFVQTQWIKDATVEWLKRDEKEISIVPVSLNIDGINIKRYSGALSRVFFYPARAEIYKNHQAIIDACYVLKSKGINDYQVILTIEKDMSSYANRIIEQTKDLPIQCIGTVSYEKIWDYYSQSILLFPSYLETCGLPLLEAKAACARIIASDMPFSHEALDDYPNVEFFPYDNPKVLADRMEQALVSPKYTPCQQNLQGEKTSLLQAMIPYLQG